MLLLGAVLIDGCALLGRKRLDYTDLTSADRIEVRTTENKEVATITDREKVEYAIRFIQDRQDRWGDRISVFVPTFQLQFFKGSHYLGGYGVRRNMLVASPSHHGWWWRDVPAAEIDVLLKTLGLQPDK